MLERINTVRYKSRRLHTPLWNHKTKEIDNMRIYTIFKCVGLLLLALGLIIGAIALISDLSATLSIAACLSVAAVSFLIGVIIEEFA